MRSRTTAALLSLFLGIFGMQFFYLGRTGLGIMCIVFTFTGVLTWLPVLLGVVTFFRLLGMSDAEFMKKYNRDEWKKQQENPNYVPINQREQRQSEQSKSQRRNEEARRRMNPTPQYSTASTVAEKEKLKQSGLQKFKDFDYYGAIEEFGKALAIDASDVAIHWNLTCCYSLTEQKELAFYHLQKAVEGGFKDWEKIKTHDALAFLRVQPEFDAFQNNGYQMTESMEHSDVLQQLKDLQNKRAQGVLTEKEFADMSKRLFE